MKTPSKQFGISTILFGSVLLALVSSCTPSASAIETAIAKTRAAYTLTPTSTPSAATTLTAVPTATMLPCPSKEAADFDVMMGGAVTTFSKDSKDALGTDNAKRAAAQRLLGTIYDMTALFVVPRCGRAYWAASIQYMTTVLDMSMAINADGTVSEKDSWVKKYVDDSNKMLEEMDKFHKLVSSLPNN